MKHEAGREEFSVYVFFPDGTYHAEARYVTAEKAMRTAKRLIESVASKMGIARRVIVTDGGDFINFEWKNGEGITYPPEDELKS